MEKKMIKILQVLDRASCSCPLGYITLHTNIPKPLEILESLEEEGYVCRCENSNWSPSMYPQFEITTKGHQELGLLEVYIPRVLKRIVAQKLVNK